MAGVDGRAVEDDGAGVVVLRGELEIVGGGALAGYGCGCGRPAVDGKEEGSVGNSRTGEWDGGRVGGAGDGEITGAGAEGGGSEGQGDLTGGVGGEGIGVAGCGNGVVACRERV